MPSAGRCNCSVFGSADRKLPFVYCAAVGSAAYLSTELEAAPHPGSGSEDGTIVCVFFLRL
jgi:hypothetical protein